MKKNRTDKPIQILIHVHMENVPRKPVYNFFNFKKSENRRTE
jgi:hypothetical protein